MGMAISLTFDHCAIHVSIWDLSNAFYRDMLGAELVRRPRGWAHRLRNAQVNLHGSGFTPAGVAPAGAARAIIASNGAGSLPMPSLISSAAA
jgi:catechol 2,3-dioxygenase-like lactoylglutathione lyase family enzyme